MLGILALLLVKDHQKTKNQHKSFDERIINCTYTIQERLLGIAVCSLITLKDYPQSLTNADILGQGNLNLVSEKSGKSQGILLSIICGNPVKIPAVIFLGLFQKKIPGGEEGRQYIFLWVLVRKVFKLYGSLVFDQI